MTYFSTTIKGGLRPPTGCARLDSLAVLAGQHQEHDVVGSAARPLANSKSELVYIRNPAPVKRIAFATACGRTPS